MVKISGTSFGIFGKITKLIYYMYFVKLETYFVLLYSALSRILKPWGIV